MSLFKSLPTILLLALTTISSATTYYVATTGDDNNQGNKEYPFKTLNKAWSVVTAGDTVFLRGGTYNNSIMPPNTYFRNKNGTSSDPIVISNYQNEKPILNYNDVVYTSQKSGFWIENVKYLHIKGIRITNINQPREGNIPQYGIMLWNNVSNCTFEQIETDHIGGWGITIGDNCSNNLFLNCDSHHNADPYSAIPYGWADGFQSGSPTSTNNTFKGCRAWSNSDDGWDFRLYDGSVTLESCWSFRNGFKPNTWEHGGNGEGFKLGIKRLPSTSLVLRTLSNCLAFDNYSIGFHSSSVTGYGTFKSALYNNTAFRNGINRNGQGFCFQQPDVENILKNNLSYKNPADYVYPCNINTNNSWNTGSVSDADFQSLDTTGVSGIRKENGDLPDIPFLRLTQTSRLIDLGISVGLPYTGKAPDLGAFESILSNPIVINQNPVVSISSPVKSSTHTSPATITIDATASDPDGTIIKVEFFQGNIKIGEKLTSPYSITWKDVPDGTYSITATATDNSNSKTVSAAVSITVNKSAPAANQLPLVSIASPIKGSSFTSPANVTIDVNASDPDGIISKVELFNGSVKLLEVTSSPYSFTLKDLPAGTYDIKAVATDNLNASTVSSILQFSVVAAYNEKKEYFNLYPNPNNGQFTVDFSSLVDAENFIITIVDLIGKTVYREELSAEEATRQFDLSHLNSGIYVLMITASQILLTQKFIKN